MHVVDINVIALRRNLERRADCRHERDMNADINILRFVFLFADRFRGMSNNSFHDRLPLSHSIYLYHLAQNGYDSPIGVF